MFSVAWFLLCLGLPLLVSAQTLTGGISGVVTDPSGARIAVAKVSTRNLSTNEARESTSDSAGAFSLSSLSPGTYEVTVEVVGFQKTSVTGVEVSAGATNRVDLSLKLGSVETVSVTSDTAAVQTDSAEVRGELDNTQLSSLPVPANRNYESALILFPGINPTANQHSVAGNPGRGLSFQSNGSFGNTNNIRIDGATANMSGCRTWPHIARGWRPFNPSAS